MKIKSVFFSNLFYLVSLYGSRPPCFIAYVSDHELTAEYGSSPPDTFAELVGNGCHFPCQVLLIMSPTQQFTLSWGIVGFTGIPLDKRVSLFPSQIIFQCVHRMVLK